MRDNGNAAYLFCKYRVWQNGFFLIKVLLMKEKYCVKQSIFIRSLNKRLLSICVSYSGPVRRGDRAKRML